MLLAGHDAPGPLGLDQFGEAKAKIKDPVAGGVNRLVPERRRPATPRIAWAVEVSPVTTVELGRLYAGPEARADLAHVPRQDPLQSLVFEMRSDASPAALDGVVFHVRNVP